MRLAVLLLLALPAAAAAAPAPGTQVLMAEDPEERRFQEELGYADAVVAGDTIYLSGIVVGRRGDEDSRGRL